MEIFSLVGKVVVDYSDACEQLERISEAADETADSLHDTDKAAGTTSGSVDKAGNAAEGANSKFSTWQMTLANLWSKAIVKVGSWCEELGAAVLNLGQDFTATMSEVQAISGATSEQMQMLEDTAREFGSTTVFSATEAAEALKYMSLAGWSVEESTSALGGVLDLAAAAGMGLAKASDMVTDYLSAFGMKASESAYFADMLAYAQSHSNTTAEQLGEAYRNCAANLNAAGQDVETVTSLLEAMANQGYKGSEAGTALAAIMRDITNGMKDGQIAIGDTTVSVMDASGNFRDLTDVLAEVEAATAGMGDAQRAAALAETFTADSTKGLNLLLNEGSEAFTRYEEELRSADGAASDMAKTMNSNLKGDIASMKSAFEELGLKIFDKLETPLRTATQFITESVVPAISGFIENLDTIAPIFSGIAVAVGLFVTALNFSSIVSTVTGVLSGLKTAVLAVNAAMAANPIMLVVSLIAGLVAALVMLWNTNEDFRNAVIAVWEAVKEFIGNAVEAIKTTVVNVFNAVKNTVSNIMDGIKTVFTNVWNSIKSAVTSVVNAIKTAITTPIEAAKNTVSNLLNGIKTTFSTVFNGIKSFLSPVVDWLKGIFNFNWSLPKIKLPHFTISGSFSLNPPSVPHFGIEWYKKAMDEGMIMNQPTIFGYNPKSNRFLAGGEAGSETVVGTHSLMDMIQIAVDNNNRGIVESLNYQTERIERLIDIQSQFFSDYAYTEHKTVLSVNGKELSAAIASDMDEELGRILKRKRRGR